MRRPEPVPERSASPGIWILDSWKDLVFFIGTPLLILPLIGLASLRFSAESIGLAVASLGAQGHHLPGMMRAYGDRELFRRYRVRFIVAPIFLLVICGLFARTNLEGLLVLVLLWGFWHGLAQVYGFIRIYDAKVGAKSHWRARLDMAMCIAWFVGGFLYSPEKIAQTLAAFYTSGGPFLSSTALDQVRIAWGIVTAMITTAFLAYTFIAWRRGEPCNYAKLLLMASSFSFWWFAMVYLNPIILGVAAFEVFHDVQYLTIVWVYNRTRVEKGRPVGAFTQFLFRRSTMMIGLYLGLVFAYGYLSMLDKALLASEDFTLTLYGLVAASGFLHFYYDGFIWKIRESGTSEGLGMQSQAAKAAKLPSQPWFMHGLRWCIFVVPAVWLLTSELRGSNPASELAQRQSVVALVPESAEAHHSLGIALAGLGRFDEAVKHYQEALRIKPNYAKAHHNLGASLNGLGRFAEAITNFREALRLNPNLAGAHISLGNALIATGKARDAIAHYQEALRTTPNAEAHNNWANALAGLGRFDEAVPHYQDALQIKPNYAEAHVNWGNALARLRRFDEAVPHYQEALRLNPNYAEAHLYWGSALAVRGQFQNAATHFQEALRLKPDLMSARDNLRRVKTLLQKKNGASK